MGSEHNTPQVRVDTGMGIISCIGWLFTIAYAQLGLWTGILGLAIWPCYLGAALR